MQAPSLFQRERVHHSLQRVTLAYPLGVDNRLAGLGRTFRPFPSLAGRGKKAGLGTAARLRKIEDFSKASPNLGTFFLKGRGRGGDLA